MNIDKESNKVEMTFVEYTKLLNNYDKYKKAYNSNTALIIHYKKENRFGEATIKEMWANEENFPEKMKEFYRLSGLKLMPIEKYDTLTAMVKKAAEHEKESTETIKTLKETVKKLRNRGLFARLLNIG